MSSRADKDYLAWRQMIVRCTSKKCASYPRYGGRGIAVCERWTKSFAHFMEDMGPRPEGMTIERINNDGAYDQSNCRWATRIEQAKNRRSNILLEFDGEKHCLGDWAKKLGFTYFTLYWRYAIAGWSIRRTLTTPSRWAEPDKLWI